MTPEQNVLWQQAIMQAYPAPTPDGEICTFEQWKNHRRAEAALLSLMPEVERITFLRSRVKDSAERLADWHLPEWALEIRDFCARWYYDDSVPTPDFAFRTDVGLLGLQLRYSMPEERAESYNRLLLGFLSRSLRLLVDSEEVSKNAELQHDFEGFRQICCLCESESHYLDPQNWLDIKNTFGKGRRSITNRTRAPILVDAFTRVTRRALFQIDEPGPLGRRLPMFWFYAEYREFHLPENRIAQAFLNALETQCPTPDWISLE